MEKKEAYKFTSKDAENYDEYLGPVLFEPYGEYLAQQINVTSGSAVLELACGSGRVTKHISEVLPDDATFWATDISSDMLDIAKHKPGTADINFAVEDMQSLSFADNTFDLVVCQFGMMFLPDKQKGFNEIYRVLKPGGKLMLFTWDSAANNPVFDLLINKLITPLFEGGDTTWLFTPFSLYDTRQLADWMQNAGFKNPESQNIRLKSGSASPEHLENGVFRKHPLGWAVMTKDASAFEPMAQKLKQELISRYGNADISFPMSAYLTTGIK